jgi:ATP-dependent HslUV protease ATP-binding subunit HslU
MADFSPREIVSELDRFIVGQKDAKRAVAIALRNRWRRQRLDPSLRDEVIPKNILMIGPTGVGKTEIARRLARLANAPFIKVEATKFTEVGYVGRDVEQIVRDLLEVGILQVRTQRRNEVRAKAQLNAEDRVLDALVGANAAQPTRESFRRKLRSGELDDKEIEIQVAETATSLSSFELPGMPGSSMGMINISDFLGKAFGGRTKQKRLSVKESYDVLISEESDKLLDQDKLVQEAIAAVENNGIVFLDELDKISARSERQGADVSREGVQRDLLPLIEGTTVSTKHGPVRTDHVLFIASGAFHIAKPSDLLPELQGRLPIRVELKALSEEDFRRILTEPEASLIKQYSALLGTEGIKLEFSEEGVAALAGIAVQINSSVENIGARRLHTVLERVLDEVSFSAPDRSGQTIVIDRDYVENHVGDLARNADLSRFIL